MAAKRKAGKGAFKAARAMPGKRRSAARGARMGARAAKRSAYVQALLHDERVRDRLNQGLRSARIVYLRARRRPDAAEALLEDRRPRRELRRAIRSFREAAAAYRAATARRRRRTAVTVLLPAVAIGGAGVLAANKGIRQTLIGRVSSSGTGHDAAAGDAGAIATAPGATIRPPTSGDNAPPFQTQQ